VLHVVDGLGLSGKTRHLVSVLSKLDRGRFAPVVCRLNDEPSPLIAQLADACVPLFTVACRDGVQPKVMLQIASVARSVKADVVHCCNPRPMLYGGFAARLLGIRTTVGCLSAFACQVPDRDYEFLPQALTTASRRNVYRNRLAVASMRVLVAVSSSLGRRFCNYNGIPIDKLRTIAYGADLDAVDRVPAERVARLRRELGFRSADVVIGSVGRLVEQKDYPTALRAFAIAAAHVPNLRMAIVGDGPLRPALERLARDIDVAPRVRFLGQRDDVPALLQCMDLFALSSKFEPFGVALLEAKAARLPIVATAVNEIPDIVTNDESGLLTPPGDAAGMAAAFIRLARDRECRMRFGTRGRREAEQHSLAAAVAAYEGLYDAV
jgi:glycosyltransferase involved in cell wall biosynthesis